MTFPAPVSPDHAINKSKTSPSCKLHLIQVDDVEPLQKGIYTVMPAYNEELVIGSVILRTKQFFDRVIVVDDGSSDRTAEYAFTYYGDAHGNFRTAIEHAIDDDEGEQTLKSYSDSNLIII